MNIQAHIYGAHISTLENILSHLILVVLLFISKSSFYFAILFHPYATYLSIFSQSLFLSLSLIGLSFHFFFFPSRSFYLPPHTHTQYYQSSLS